MFQLGFCMLFCVCWFFDCAFGMHTACAGSARLRWCAAHEVKRERERRSKGQQRGSRGADESSHPRDGREPSRERGVPRGLLGGEAVWFLGLF